MPRPSFIYFSHNTLDVPRVARQCMVALCEGASMLGADAEIVSILIRRNPSEPRHPPLTELYGVQAPLRFVSYRLWGVSVGEGGGRVAILRLCVYLRHMLSRSVRRAVRSGALVTFSARNASVLAMLVLFRRTLYRHACILADVHGKPTSRFMAWMHRLVDGNVCISQHLANHLVEQCGVEAGRVRVAHSGVKPERFRVDASQDEAAALVGIDRNRPIVCYTGKVYFRYEEIGYLIEVARRLGDEITMVIVGGRPDHIPPWQDECARSGVTNVVFTGFQPPSRIPAYLRAADLLVLYYSPSPLNDYRSPGKLFEYLAAGTPMVASRFHGIAEIVQDGVNGFLIEPYRPDVLALRIRELLQDRSRWTEVGRQAVATAERYTWTARAGAFLDFATQLDAGRRERARIRANGKQGVR